MEITVNVTAPELVSAINNLAAAIAGNSAAPQKHSDQFMNIPNDPADAPPFTQPQQAAPTQAPVAPQQAAPAPAQPVAQTPAPAPVAPQQAAPAKAIGMDDLARAGAALVDQGKMPQVIALLGKYEKFRIQSSNYGDSEGTGGVIENDGRRYPKSILTFKKDKQKSAYHPTQKPVALLEYLIRTYSMGGDLVLDNCMGSGSTGVACIISGRNFIGIPELMPDKVNDELWISFNFAKGCDEPELHGVHFFIDDYQFNRVWAQPDTYLNMLRRFKTVCTPDFSTFTDFPKAIQIYNHYRKHWLGAYWQENGIHVIPTISWSDHESYHDG